MYELYIAGGSLGEIDRTAKTIHRNKRTYRYERTFETRERAKAAGKSYVDSYEGGRKSYYRPGYAVIEKK